jgi:response regulator RpfG family c-di-GMP phosphodiesterase
MEVRNQRILCIDNHASRNLAVYLLERAGYEVWEVSSLADGVLLAQSNHFDLYLLNHKLVPSSTIGSCNAYHELGPNPQVLFYSTVLYPYEQRRIRCRLHDHMVEPITVSDVVKHVSTLIESHEQNRVMKKDNKTAKNGDNQTIRVVEDSADKRFVWV